ncbi:MAG: glycogen/starch synthase, partial [Alphaproteobacteria bacterium]|nr:glycogen/starch synthase [Alphaproteobacteria bacterium]
HFWPGSRAKTVFTIHNLQYLGMFPPWVMEQIDLPGEAYGMDGVEFHGQVSFLKAGIFYGDAITAVSPTYAHEIMSPALGNGLDGLLRHRGHAVHGILNGIDDEVWNPATDPLIEHPYSTADMSGKASNKVALQRIDVAEGHRPDRRRRGTPGTIGRPDRRSGNRRTAPARHAA